MNSKEYNRKRCAIYHEENKEKIAKRKKEYLSKEVVKESRRAYMRGYMKTWRLTESGSKSIKQSGRKFRTK